jgi:hypothetical protein
VEQFPYEQAEQATRILFRLIESKGVPPDMQRKVLLDSKVIVNGQVE